MLALGKGDNLTVSSGIITPTHDVHVVNGGGGDIDTINVPSPSFCGLLVLICVSGSVGWSASGNIARANAINVGASAILVYNPAASKWFPVNA